MSAKTKIQKTTETKTATVNGSNGHGAPVASYTAKPTDEAPQLSAAELEAEMAELDREARQEQAEELQENVARHAERTARTVPVGRLSAVGEAARRATRPAFWLYLLGALALGGLAGWLLYRGESLYTAGAAGWALLAVVHLYVDGEYTRRRLEAVGTWAATFGCASLVGALAAIPLAGPVYAVARHYRAVGFWTYHWTTLSLWFDHYTDSLRFWYVATAATVALATVVLAACTGRGK